MPKMMSHSTDGHRTVWHPPGSCDECGRTVHESTRENTETPHHPQPPPAGSFTGGLFDAPPPTGKYTRDELAAQAREKRMAGPPRIFPVGTTACPDCAASFLSAPVNPSFGTMIMHKCGETTPPPIDVRAFGQPREYGDVFYSYIVKNCPRCGASSDFFGARRGRWSWAHACVI